MTDCIVSRGIDKEGNEQMVTRFGEAMVATRHTDISIRFEYGISDFDVTASRTVSGTVTHANSMATVSTGTGIGSAELRSLHAVEYMPAHEIQAFFTTKFTPGGNTGSYQRAGIYDSDDGFYLGYEGNDFGVTVRDNGSSSFINSTSFSNNKVGTNSLVANPSGFILDPSKLNLYRITYGWLGAAPCTFAVYGGQNRGWITMHTRDSEGALTRPLTGSPSQFFRMEAGRSASSGNVLSVSCASIGVGSSGQPTDAGSRGFATDFTKTLGANAITYIGSIKNNTTFQTKTNKVSIQLTAFGAATDGTKNVRFRLRKNSTTGANYTNIDSNNSVISQDISGTFTTTGSVVWSIPMTKADTVELEVRDHQLILHPGEEWAITGYSTAASEVFIALRWIEKFS